jgi:3-carboxy-cis,cis-muconate cycloisomerase
LIAETGEPYVNHGQTNQWLDPLFTTDAMRAVFSDRGRLQGILDFEAALATVEARCGIIPRSAAQAITSQAKAELFDLVALARASALAGNTAIPVVKALTSRVAAVDQEAARYVHWGATSQDAMDTGLVLQSREALGLIEASLASLSGELTLLAEEHKLTPMAGRTWLVQASPTTFGLKAAGWYGAVQRVRFRLSSIRQRALVIQLGGAVGTLASLGDRGLEVAGGLAEELSLGLPDIPWHSSRDRGAELATSLGILVGSLGKIARDISLLSQTEVGEVFESHAPGRGGSSTMPQKRNPVGCAVVLAAAMRIPALVGIALGAMVQEHERGLGGWHAEWETLPEIFLLTAGAAEQILRVVQGLEIDSARMRTNLEATHGLIFAEAVSMSLAAKIGRQAAHELVERACETAVEHKRPLSEVLAKDQNVTAHLSLSELLNLFDPTAYLGSAGKLVDRALAGEGT